MTVTNPEEIKNLNMAFKKNTSTKMLSEYLRQVADRLDACGGDSPCIIQTWIHYVHGIEGIIVEDLELDIRHLPMTPHQRQVQ